MITKEKIIEILSNYSSYADSSLGNIIQEEKHDIIAEDILSKLRQPPVVGRSEQLVCDECYSFVYERLICAVCGKEH